MTRFMSYISNAKVICSIAEGIPRAAQAVRLCRDLASESLATEESLVADLAFVETFIADELECRESSMMPPSDDDARYIISARTAKQTITRLKKHFGAQPNMRYAGNGVYTDDKPLTEGE